MSVFENFPYTNFHNLNLDWVLNKLKSFEERLNKIEKDGGGTGGGSSIDKDELEAKIAAKQDKLTFDSKPTENSTNPVTSGGVYTAIDSTTTTLNNSLDHVNTELEAKIAAKQDKLTFDDLPKENSTNPVTSGGLFTDLNIRSTAINNNINGIFHALTTKQDKLTFDYNPTKASENPIMSGGVYEALRVFSYFQTLNPVYDNRENGYTLIDCKWVEITNQSIFEPILNILQDGGQIWSIAISLSIGQGVQAIASVIGPSICTGIQMSGSGHLLATCYQNSSNEILKFDIRIDSNRMSIMFISPNPTNMTSIHVNVVKVDVLWRPAIL